MERIQKRFDELAAEAEAIADTIKTETKQIRTTNYLARQPTWRDSTTTTINFNAFSVWRHRLESTVYKVFGESHPHYKDVKAAIQTTSAVVSFKNLQAIMLAAKADFEDGFLFDVRRLVHAEVFADELEQAEHFLENRYKVPAAVVAGTVLESTLRELCRQNDVAVTDKSGNDITEKATIDPMSQRLAKASVYNATRAKQIVAWAGIRNDAAHGKPDKFDEAQVRDMISGVRDFVAQQMD